MWKCIEEKRLRNLFPVFLKFISPPKKKNLGYTYMIFFQITIFLFFIFKAIYLYMSRQNKNYFYYYDYLFRKIQYKKKELKIRLKRKKEGGKNKFPKCIIKSLQRNISIIIKIFQYVT